MNPTARALGRREFLAASSAALLAGCGAVPGRGGPDAPSPAVAPPPGVKTGLEVLLDDALGPLRGKRLGLITNPTGADRRLRPAAELLPAAGARLTALFGPEHGYRGARGAGAAVGDSRDAATGAPVYSLYGSVRRPTRDMLKDVDALVYDLQDVGARPYTYLSTLRGALESAAEAGIALWVLDRPDPLGGLVLDGPVLEEAHESFVGPHTLPLRYALTAAEFARLVAAERRIPARLEFVPLQGWRRAMEWRETGLPWIAPSPNIPVPETCLVYPGFVLLEGTNLSEGRGTTRPFQLLGAPWLDAEGVVKLLADEAAAGGAVFRTTEFTPSDSKHKGQACGGVEVHVLDPKAFRACRAAAAFLSAVRKRHPAELAIEAKGFDRLAGGEGLRRALLAGDPPERIARSWEPAQEEFRKRAAPHLLYA